MTGQTQSAIDRQRLLEVDMRQRGFAKAVERLKGDYKPESFGGMIAKYIEATSLRIEEACLEAVKAPGRPNPGVRRLIPMDSEKVAAIALDCAMAAVVKRATLLKLALHIGRACETQAKLERYSEQDEKKFSRLYKKALETTSNKQRLRYKLTRALSGTSTESWTKEECLAVGFLTIDVMVQYPGLIELERVYHRKRSTTYVVGTDMARDLMREMMLAKVACTTQYGPLICQPLPWSNETGEWTGGYYTPEIQIPLVKSKSAAFQKRVQSLPLTPHIDAVNFLQSVPYRINQRALGFARYAFEQQLDIPGLPMTERSLPPNEGLEGEELEAWKRKARDIHAFNKRLPGILMQGYQIMQTAEEYERYAIWYALNLDFRGRINYFSGPSILNPQGNDLSKSLLEFSEALPLGPTGYQWFALHGANEYGVKGTIEDRVKWVDEYAHRIVASSMMPLQYDWWTKADSPLQFLRWCEEYARYTKDPENFRTAIPCHQDGTCNGIQHLAAMARDARAAQAVNMRPTEKPQDMYKIVADLINSRIAEMEDPLDVELAYLWVTFGFDRSLTKRPCMTKAYGSTLHSCIQYTRDYVTEKLEAGAEDVFGEFRTDAIVWMAKLMWDCINATVKGPQEVMEWLQAVARAYNAKGLPMEWVTPSNFTVHHYYPEWKSRQIKTYIDGREVKPRIREEDANKISEHEVVNGISANLTHSMDAAHLVMIVNRLKAEGVTHVLTIHDSIGVHPCHGELLSRVIRETFYELYSNHDPLEGLVKRATTDGVEIPPAPEKGTLNLQDVLSAKYFFS